jgi:hypothetical protein
VGTDQTADPAKHGGRLDTVGLLIAVTVTATNLDDSTHTA